MKFLLTSYDVTNLSFFSFKMKYARPLKCAKVEFVRGYSNFRQTCERLLQKKNVFGKSFFCPMAALVHCRISAM